MSTRKAKMNVAIVAPISSLQITLAYPRVTLTLLPSSARANLFAGD